MAVKNNLKNQVKFGQGQDPTRGGRPKKLISSIVGDLEAQGYKVPTIQEIRSCYLLLVQLPQDELNELSKKGDTPILVKEIAKAIKGGKGFEIIEKMLDRANGKASQQVQLSGDSEKPIIQEITVRVVE